MVKQLTKSLFTREQIWENAFDKQIHNDKSQLHTFGKQHKVLAKACLGICKKNNMIQMKIIIHVF